MTLGDERAVEANRVGEAGRMRTVFITDPLEQLQGRAGERQVTTKAEVAVTHGVLPVTAGTLAMSTSPD